MAIETAETRTEAGRANGLPLWALVAAGAVSGTGSALTWIALPWFVLVTTGSPAKTGLTGFFVVLPGFVAGLFGGTVVDRLGYKRVSIVADLVSGLGIMLVPLLYHTVGLAFWQLLALVFVGALLDVPGFTARRAMIPELAALARTRLERANAAFESVQAVSLLLGPPLAGVLIAWLGASNVLWLDAASFALSAAAVAVAIPAVAAGAREAASGRYFAELARGLRFLRQDRVLFPLAVSLALMNLVGNAFAAVALPVWVKEVYGRPAVFGLLVAIFGAGSLAGAILYGAIGHRLSRRALWIGSFLVVAVMYGVFALTPALPVIAVVLVVVGVLSGPTNPLLVTIRHERTPAELRGRVFATFSAIAQVASPLGIVLAGYAIQGFGLRPTLVALGVAAAIMSVGMLFVPAFRELRAPGREVASVGAGGEGVL
ncbi:MAG TPA: MFS transporter [Thermomicrobiales bacterium]|nr:MFS transporter [Thermomicrobiales bacterium]